MASYSDRAIVATLAASFPEARIYGLFDTDISGLAAYMSFKVGTDKHRKFPEYAALTLGRRIKNCSALPQAGRGRPFTKANLDKIAQFQAEMTPDDPDHDFLTDMLNIGSGQTIQGTNADSTTWVTALIPDLIAELSTATVDATYTPVLPAKASSDKDFPKLEHADVIIEDLATTRDFWHQAWMACEKEGKRPTELELLVNWQSHKRQRSEDRGDRDLKRVQR